LENDISSLLSVIALRQDFSVLVVVVVGLLLAALLSVSALASGSEAAYFSLSHSDVSRIKSGRSRASKLAMLLLQHPDRLLSCILLINNVANVALVVLATFFMQTVFVVHSALFGFIFETVVVTFVLLLCGEILPKIYARYNTLSVVTTMALPLYALSVATYPFNFWLTKITSWANRRVKFIHANNLSIGDLSNALNVTRTQSAEDRRILKGIVKFGNIDVHDIMTPRVDVVAMDINADFATLRQLIVKWEYSRLPVYEDSFDSVKGILYIKDLLQYLDEKDFAWQKLVRPPYFVPENKKLNDLLEEFQAQKNHLAIVVDEYGGSSGIVTLEDILEEIVGEISDESDREELPYKRQSDGTYIFEGKTLLNDFCKLMDLSDTYFDSIAGSAETLAGALLELKGDFPVQGEEICYRGTTFKVAAFERRRIQKVHVAFDDKKEPKTKA
jgi:gliding motility-associated protein GldE